MSRSVGIILKNAPPLKVREWLDRFGSKAYYDHQWYYPSASGEVVLYMWLYESFTKDFEEDEYEEISQVLNSAPSVWIHVDIPGRFDGTAEVKLFVVSALKEFEGVAYDVYTDHFWTRMEIENDIKIEDYHFFDFKRWSLASAPSPYRVIRQYSNYIRKMFGL